MIGIASALICMIVFGITWARMDIGTAVGIGQFLAGVLALANAAIYFALQAYSTRLSQECLKILYRTEMWAKFLHLSHLTDGMALELIRQDPDLQFLIAKDVKQRRC